MKLRNLAEKDISWLQPSSNFDGIIVSTRIRLARNLSSCPMPGQADNEDLKKCLNKIFIAAEDTSFFKGATKIILSECTQTDLQLLQERNLISSETSSYEDNPAGILIDSREQMSLIINEEDHIRLQIISAGLNLFDSWEIINKADDELSSRIKFAYSEKLGYLTSCPTNTGTGMRASCQLHLPALAISGGLISTMESINKMGMVVRGLRGEGTKIMGDMLQVSNQVTLGLSEQRILDNLNRLVTQVSRREEKLREKLFKTDADSLKDRVYRAKGLLQNAYKISDTEALNLISNLKLGVYTGIAEYEIQKLNNLMIKIMPGHIQEIAGSSMDSNQRRRSRAEIIRETLSK